MKFDLAFVLVDLGNPWYKTAASEMIRSARRAYKDHDMRVVQITDSKTAHHPDADVIFNLDISVGKEQMCQFKGRAIAEHALRADRPVIFTDVDIIWNNDGMALFFRDKVNLLGRTDMPSMPFNTGIIATPPGKQAFWADYRATCDNLPAEVCGWWGDQFAMVATAARFAGEVDMMNMSEWAPAIDTLPPEPLTTPAVHFKGERKHLMIPYARMLDGGSGFEFVRPKGSTLLNGDIPIACGTPDWVNEKLQPSTAQDHDKMLKEGMARHGFTF